MRPFIGRSVRVLVVSAHFPPNFVSGGTLVPYRSAIELARRGHELAVFAGWIGPSPHAGSAFEEAIVTHELGGRAVPVRWFTTNDAIDWGSRLNYDNTAAAAEFAGMLQTFSPDVVHFHSMQGLGAGLLREAARAGVPFVVTAHDFWWWCGRQFLCDRDYHPCCPVVVAGACDCAVDRAWLDERTAATTSALRLAAQVLAVSESSAAVLRANGVPPEQLTVVHNPVVEAGGSAGVGGSAGASARPSTDGGNGVRFVFAGGPDPMKGFPVLRTALRSLVGEHGWSADLYGVAEPSTPRGAEGFPPHVRVHPPFSPDELAAVLSAADVLVVPSVMQETYSILTREALAMGLPVVTTTCLGPEEVVTDGVNGLVVPQDDPEALAAAMRELVRDPALLAQLRRAARDVELMTVSSHCDHLETIYAGICTPDDPGGERHAPRDHRAATPARPATGRRVERVLFVVGIDGAPLRYRAHLPREALALLGVHADVRHYRHPDVTVLGQEADVVVVYRVPATHQVARFIAEAHERGTPVVFDVDDLIFDPALEREIPALKILTGAERALWIQGVHRYRTTMELCDAFVGSTALLCEHASEVTGMPAFEFPNGAGIVMSRLADEAVRRPRLPGPIRVGYLSGTDTHDRDWATIEEVVVATLEAVPGAELWLVGKLTPGDAVRRLGDRVSLIGFQPWTTLPGLLRTLDVNLAPLEPGSRFNDAKSAIKWLEAGLSATPTIASPTRPFRHVIEHGANGMLAEGDDEWRDALSALLARDTLRRTLGQRARRDALLQLGPWTQGRRYLEILQSVEPRTRRASGWEDVLLDEPFEPIGLEPYGEAATDRPEPPVVPVRAHLGAWAHLGTLARRGAGSLRHRGVRATCGLVLERLGRRLEGRLGRRLERLGRRLG